MKPVDLKSNTFINSSEEINDEGPKTDDTVRISRYKNIFAKCYVPNWFQNGYMLFAFLKAKKQLESFTKNN